MVSGEELEARLARQAADMIIPRSILATGGYKRLATLRDITGSGEIIMRRPQPGQEARAECRGQFAMIFKHPDKTRTELGIGDIEEHRDCAEVEITGYGQPARRLFFDKQTDLIFKSVTSSGETSLGRFRSIEGAVIATKMLVRHGVEEIEFSFTDVRINHGVSDAVFRPQKKT